MLIKILPHQVPRFWDAVKHAAQGADSVPQHTAQSYYTWLLHDLMSHKAQLWVRMDENKILIGIFVTRIMTDKVAGCKYLSGDVIYSWKRVDSGDWQRDAMVLYQFAKQQECAYVQAYITNPKLLEYADKIGFKEHARIHRLYI